MKHLKRITWLDAVIANFVLENSDLLANDRNFLGAWVENGNVVLDVSIKVNQKEWRMFAYIIRQLAQTENVEYQVENGNIYVIKGNADLYPCIVAHMDTVHGLVGVMIVLMLRLW